MKTKTLVFIRHNNPSDELTKEVNEAIKEIEDTDCFIKDIKLSTNATENALGNGIIVYTYLILYEEKNPRKTLKPPSKNFSKPPKSKIQTSQKTALKGVDFDRTAKITHTKRQNPLAKKFSEIGIQEKQAP